ncbi:MAG: beta-eliminating lyase-related protein, partial [Pantoea sp.]|nr:beta-eliminating lyase-related protein [Pantoea sp.]
AGILAAAGLYALEHNVMRLKEDHDNARWLAEQLSELDINVSQHTNMVFAQLPPEQAAPLKAWMQARNILISTGPVTRLVTHMDVDRAALQQVVKQWKAFLAAQ